MGQFPITDKMVDVFSVVSGHVEACVLLSKTSEAKSEIRDAAVPASAERESGTSYDMLERIQKAKDYVEIGVDAEEYYRIKDSEKEADEK